MSQPSPSPLPAELPARLAARVIDALLVAAIGYGLGSRIGFGFDWLIATAAISLAYFTVADITVGTTPGKAVFGLRVIGPKGNRPTAKQAVGRESFILLGAIPFAGPILALAAWIWIFATIRSSPLRQGKHDLLGGGTRVVRPSGKVLQST